jgi:O-antigen/teichoic acid export membrane protein
VNRSSRAFKTTVVVSVLGYSAQALSLVAIPLFLKTVGAEGYGMMVTVMALMGYLGFADPGLTWGAMILIAQAHGRGGKAEIAHVVRHSAVLALGSGLVVVLALGAILAASRVGWRLPMFAGHPEADLLILIAGVQLALSLQFSVVYNLFQGLQEGYWAGVYAGVGRILGLAGAMAAAWFMRSVAAIMLVQFGFTVLSGVAAAVHARSLHPWAFSAGPWKDRAQFSAQLRIGAKNFLLQVGRTLGGSAPTLAISSILGPAQVPFYTVPSTLLTMFYTPINSWNSNMQSAYGEAWESGDKAWVRGAFRTALERALLLGGLGVALFLALGNRFIVLWTHGRLSLEPATALSISGIVTVGALIAAAQFLLTGLNRHRTAAIAEIANGVATLILVSLFLHLWGLGAVGIGVVASALGTSGWVLRREVASRLGPSCFPTASFILRVCATATAAAAAAAIVARIGQDGGRAEAAVHMVAAGAVGLVGFGVAAFALDLVGMRDILEIGRRFKGRAAASTP